MPSKSAKVKNARQYQALKDKGMSKERAARIAYSPGAPSWDGKNRDPVGTQARGDDSEEEEGWSQGWPRRGLEILT
jgi:hypothetical protein